MIATVEGKTVCPAYKENYVNPPIRFQNLFANIFKKYILIICSFYVIYDRNLNTIHKPEIINADVLKKTAQMRTILRIFILIFENIYYFFLVVLLPRRSNTRISQNFV